MGAAVSERAERLPVDVPVAAGPGSRERKRRSDAGGRRVGPRDLAALAWMVDMRAIREDDLAVLLARLGGREQVTTGAAVQVVRRWQALGLATAQRIVVGQPRVVVPTSDAAELLGLSGRVAPPAWTQVTHTITVARVRLMLEAAYGEQLAEWHSERGLRAEAAERRGGVQAGSGLGRAHLPDGVVVLADEHRVAVEVELAPKTGARIASIVKELRSSLRWDAARYFVSSAASSIVTSTVEREGGGGKNPITVEPVPDAPVTAPQLSS